MAVPNRLRDEVRPGVYGGGSSSWTRPRPAAAPAVSGHLPWTRRRIASLAALATVPIVVISGLLISSSTTAGLGVPAWLVGFLVLGAGLAIGGGGKRTWGPAVVGLLIGGAVLGVATALGVVIGIVPEPEDGSGSTGILALVVLVPVLLFFFGAPVLLFGAVLGSAIADVRVERRHRAVAGGTSGWQLPATGLERRTRDSSPLDDLGMAKATADGAATTVIREYPMDADPEALLSADTARLATIGYALESVERHRGRKGLAWGLVALLAVVVDIFTPFSLSESVSATRHGRVVATYRLRSMTHGPLQAETR